MVMFEACACIGLRSTSHSKVRKLLIAIWLFAAWFFVACTNSEPSFPFDPTIFEPTEVNSEVVIAVGKDTYVPGEIVSFSVINRSNKAIYHEGASCRYPASIVYTFVYQADSADRWERVGVDALGFSIFEEVPGIGETAPNTVVNCSWDQAAAQDLEASGADRFDSGGGTPVPVPPGRYQFGFQYSFDPDFQEVPEARRVFYSEIFEIEAVAGQP